MSFKKIVEHEKQNGLNAHMRLDDLHMIGLRFIHNARISLKAAFAIKVRLQAVYARC